MAVNSLTFEQVATVLTSIVKQATNQAVITPTDTASFVSVAQMALNASRDAVMNAISNVLGRTIFSIRPYSAKMTGLEMDSFRWGNMMRKLSIVDSDWADDPAYAWPATYDSSQTGHETGDGYTIDPWTIKEPNVLETNFYGASVYFDEMTIFEDQIETAFQGPEQLGSFLTLLMTNLSNRLEMSNEGLRRGLVCNAIAAVKDENKAERQIHLLTEYNTLTGESFTAADLYHPDNFPAFAKWAYSRIANVTDLFAANSTMFQTVISGKPILRHTPLEMLRVYMFSPMLQQVSARVLADTYHENFLRYSDVESLPYWQSIQTPSQVQAKPVYTKASDGSVVTGSNTTVSNVIGLIFDRDAMGMTILDRRVLSTPLNTKGLYRNLHVHCKQRIFFDSTEKVALLTLD